LNRAISEIPGFGDLIHRFERTISVLGRSKATFNNYSRHISALALHYQILPTELDAEQVHEYLFLLQKRTHSPSQSYFKHTVFGLRFLLKSEGLPYSYLLLPAITAEKKLPTVLSKEEVWAMLKACTLLKHRILIGLLYGCGLRCMEVRSIRLRDLDFDRLQLKVVQGKGSKDRYVPISAHLIRGLKLYIEVEKPTDYLFGSAPNGRIGGDFDSRYSQKGVQWAVKAAAKKAGIRKNVHVHTLRHTFATHLIEDGLDIITLKDLLGHENIETTMVYLHVAQNGRNKPFSPLDTLFQQCSRVSK
jgi:integrase/recombinase XerD